MSSIITFFKLSLNARHNAHEIRLQRQRTNSSPFALLCNVNTTHNECRPYLCLLASSQLCEATIRSAQTPKWQLSASVTLCKNLHKDGCHSNSYYIKLVIFLFHSSQPIESEMFFFPFCLLARVARNNFTIFELWIGGEDHCFSFFIRSKWSDHKRERNIWKI